MTPRFLILCGALVLALGVATGAFGAHGLRRLVAPDLLETWRTAAHYQLIHGLGLLLIAALWSRLAPAPAAWAGGLMLAGLLIFSLSLYALVLTGIQALGALTPVGGLLMILSWLALALAAWRGAAA
ncbi:DUF423 domain-containing protein [uncultured Castellaniella sp.]|uniref:DUF423 domain-containing protein n=1 Tax=uncultured Castellaniella sp. TaxID=647907 RepID=UPI002624402D|nr:DUF423 domain-containing protein [uncultured Castellaniella sp.]